jgi:hypothetical protein
MALAQLSIDLIAKTATFEKDLKRAADLGSQFASATVAGFTAIASGAASAVVAFDQLVKSAGNFQDLAEQIGSSAEGLASLAVSASVGGTSMDEVAAFATKLTKNLTGVDDESSKAGAALKALGLDIGELKDADPADQLERIAKALDGFQDGTGKTAVMEALAKGGAKLLPFLKELSSEGGRQVILTQQMIEQADAYSDAQARSRAKLGLYAQALATEAIPGADGLPECIDRHRQGNDGRARWRHHPQGQRRRARVRQRRRRRAGLRGGRGRRGVPGGVDHRQIHRRHRRGRRCRGHRRIQDGQVHHDRAGPRCGRHAEPWAFQRQAAKAPG